MRHPCSKKPWRRWFRMSWVYVVRSILTTLSSIRKTSKNVLIISKHFWPNMKSRFQYENWKKKSVLKPFILHVMGMVRYYLQFCPNLAEISQPLTNLLRKEANNKQDWGPEQAQAIQHRKNMFVLPTCSSILTQAWRRVFKPTLQNTHWVRFCHLVQQDGKLVEIPITQ